MKSDIQYSIIIPVYNEEKVVNETYKRLKQVMDTTGESYELIFINDGSKDDTAQIIQDLCRKDTNVKLINFSRNFGHQIAISAGMDNAAGRAVVVIDADLQDPPEVILKMAEKWKQGYEVVYGKRMKRKGESFFKKFTAVAFYRLLRSLTNVDIPVDTGDFRLIDRRVCDVMKGLKEKNRYVRGLVSWVGFRQAAVEYIREERWAGETKYPLKKMIRFALDAITSFSYKPLKAATYLGLTLGITSFLYLMIVFNQTQFVQTAVAPSVSIGMANLIFKGAIAINLVFNAAILLVLGIIGEYVGRIYDESKDRPLYIIKNKVGFDYDKRNNETHQ